MTIADDDEIKAYGHFNENPFAEDLDDSPSLI